MRQSFTALVFVMCGCTLAGGLTIGCGQSSQVVAAAGNEPGSANDAGEASTPAGPDSGTDGPAVTPHTAPLLPLAVGRTWTYRGSYRYAPDEYTLRADALSVIDGRQTFELVETWQPPYRSSEEQKSSFTQFREAAYWSSYDGGHTWYETYRWPKSDGEIWKDSEFDRTFRWKHLGTQSVEAGTFDDCWEQAELLSDGAVNSRVVLCSGVGPVILEYGRSGIDSDYRHYELSAKNF